MTMNDLSWPPVSVQFIPKSRNFHCEIDFKLPFWKEIEALSRANCSDRKRVTPKDKYFCSADSNLGSDDVRRTSGEPGSFLFRFNDNVGLGFRQSMETVDDLSDFGKPGPAVGTLEKKVEEVNQKNEGKRTFFSVVECGSEIRR